MAGSGSENMYSSSSLYSINQNNTNFFIPLENPIYGASISEVLANKNSILANPSISEVLASPVINEYLEVTDGGTFKETSFDNNW